MITYRDKNCNVHSSRYDSIVSGESLLISSTHINRPPVLTQYKTSQLMIPRVLNNHASGVFFCANKAIVECSPLEVDPFLP